MKYKILVGGVIGVPVTVVEYLNGGVSHENCRERIHSWNIQGQRIYKQQENVFKDFYIIGLDRYTIPKDKLIGGRAGINGIPKYARVFIRRNI